MSWTVQNWESCFCNDSISVLGLPLPELLLKYALPKAATVLGQLVMALHMCA